MRAEENRLEEEAMVLKKLVEVAEVALNFWRVVEPITNRSPEALMVEVAVPPTERVLAVKT